MKPGPRAGLFLFERFYGPEGHPPELTVQRISSVRSCQSVGRLAFSNRKLMVKDSAGPIPEKQGLGKGSNGHCKGDLGSHCWGTKLL